MSDQTSTGMTDIELEEFAGRIAGWAAGLTPGERALWDAMLVRAATPQADISGHIATFGTGALNAYNTAAPQNSLGNFEIQRLMSTFSQAETLASNILKKMNEVRSGIIGNI